MEDETAFATKFNKRIKIDEFNTAPPCQETYQPNKDGDCLENQIKDIDEELNRKEINDSNYLGNIGGSQTAQKVTASDYILNVDPVSKVSGIWPDIQVPSQINEHVTSHGPKMGKNPKQKMWTRIECDKKKGGAVPRLLCCLQKET